MSEREIPSKVPRHVDWPEEPSHERGSKAALRPIYGIVWRPSVTWLPMSAIA